MVKLLAKIFIKNKETVDDSSIRSTYGKICGLLGIILNIFLFSIKLFAGILSGAISIVSDAFNNLTDAASSIISLLGFRMSEQKADKDHPFGHGRIEYITGLVISFLIIIVGFELGRSSAEKIFNPEQVAFSTITVAILVTSIVVKAYMAFYNSAIGKKINSSSLKATAMDSLSDCIATSTVLVCLIVSSFFSVNIDAYCGLAVALFIMYSGVKSAKETISPLLGNPPEKEFIDKIYSIVSNYESVEGTHDLIVHDYGPGRSMISFHAEVSSTADLMETHDMIDNLEKELREKLRCDVVIHIDPIATDDKLIIATKNKISALVTCIDKDLSIHDFRMVTGPTHTNVIFDVLVPYTSTKTDKEIRDSINTIVKSIDENYFAVINIDKSYI